MNIKTAFWASLLLPAVAAPAFAGATQLISKYEKYPPAFVDYGENFFWALVIAWGAAFALSLRHRMWALGVAANVTSSFLILLDLAAVMTITWIKHVMPLC
jgi:hypothetical protein